MLASLWNSLAARSQPFFARNVGKKVWLTEEKINKDKAAKNICLKEEEEDDGKRDEKKCLTKKMRTNCFLSNNSASRYCPNLSKLAAEAKNNEKAISCVLFFSKKNFIFITSTVYMSGYLTK